MKDIKNYVGLYLNCDVFFDRRIWKMFKVSESIIHLKREGESVVMVYPHDAKPVLRRLESMTEKEQLECVEVVYNYSVRWSAKESWYAAFESLVFPRNDKFLSKDLFLHLLKNGYDLFQLIDSGLAIDSSTLNPQA